MVPPDLLAWCDRALLSPACRVICKQALSLGSRNVFFSTRSRFIVWFPVRSLHFPSSPLPVSDTLFFYFLCGSLLVLPPVPLSFVILPKLSWFGGQGVFYSLSFLYFFNSCRAQITSPRLLERHCQLHGGDVGSAVCSSCSEPAGHS